MKKTFVAPPFLSVDSKKSFKKLVIGIGGLVLVCTPVSAASLVGPEAAAIPTKSVGDLLNISDFNALLDVARKFFVDEKTAGTADDLVGMGTYTADTGTCPAGTTHLDFNENTTVEAGECFQGMVLNEGKAIIGQAAPLGAGNQASGNLQVLGDMDIGSTSGGLAKINFWTNPGLNNAADGYLGIQSYAMIASMEVAVGSNGYKDSFVIKGHNYQQSGVTDASFLRVEGTINQSGTSNYAGILLDVTENTVGSGQNYLMDLRVGGSSKFNVTNTGNVGIGTTSPGAQLSIDAPTTSTSDSNFLIKDGDGNIIMAVDNSGQIFIKERNNTATPLIPYASSEFVHSFTGNSLKIGNADGDYGFDIVSNQNRITSIGGAARPFYLADSAGDFMTTPASGDNIQFSRNVGIGTATPTATLDVAGGIRLDNNEWISARDDVGTGVVNMFRATTDGAIELGAPLLLGALTADTDSGAVSIFNMPVSSSAVSGTEMSASVQIDSENVFKIYAEADGSGGIQNKSVQVSGALHAPLFCDENGTNCKTVVELAASGSLQAVTDVGATTTNGINLTGAVGSLANGLTFGVDANTGIYENSNDSIHITLNGSYYAFDSTYFHLGSGTKAAIMRETPSNTNPVFVPIRDDNNTGIGWAAADQLSLIAGGVEGVRVEATGITVNGNITVTGTVDGVDVAALSTTVGTKADKVSGATADNLAGLDASGNLTDSGLRLYDAGTALTDIWSASKIQSAITSGVGTVTEADTLGTVTARGATTSNAITTGGLLVNGGLGDITKGVSFGDGDTGLYESAANELDVSIAGTSRWQISSNFFEGMGGNRAPSMYWNPGTLNNPAYSFSGDYNTGLTQLAGDQLSLIANGIEGLRVNTATTGVNYLDVTPSATTDAVQIGAAGTDTNVDLALMPKGTGMVGVGTTSPSEFLHLLSATGADANIRLEQTGSAVGAYTEIGEVGDSLLTIAKNTTSGAAGVYVDAIPGDGTSNSSINFFRLTNTTGDRLVQFFLGDGTTTVDSQIGVGGDDSFFNVSGGNVGIGENLPKEKLHVSGAAVIGVHTNAIPVAGTIEWDGSNFRGYDGAAWTSLDDVGASTLDEVLTAGATSAQSATLGGLTVDTDTLHVDATNDRVGIGTTSPTSKLHINGGVGSLATGLTFGDGDTGLYESSDDNLYFNTGGGWRFIVSSSVIQSNANLIPGSANTKDLGSSARYWKGLYANTGYFSKNVGIGTTTPTATLQVSQSTTGLGTVSNTASGTTVTGVGTQFTNTFKVGDTITINGETVAISAIASDTSMTTAVIIGANTGVAYTLVGGDRFVVKGNGNVGIGTTSPTEKLQIDTGNGVFSFKDYLMSYSSTLSILALNNGDAIFGTNTGTGKVQFKTNATNRITILNDGNVGIGTTTPSEKLEVYDGTLKVIGTNGDYSSMGETGLTINTPTSSYPQLNLMNTTSHWRLQGNPAGNFSIQDISTNKAVLNIKEGAEANSILVQSNSDVILADITGSVGIGTQTPAARLDVDGTFKLQTGATVDTIETTLTSDVTHIPTSSAVSAAISSAVGGVSTNAITQGDSVVTVTDTGTDGTITFTTDGAVGMTVDNAGFVGIGTTTPSEKLDVVGNIAVSGTVDGVDISALAASVVANQHSSFVGKTTATHTGNLGVNGYRSGNTLCAADITGSHLCSQTEIIYTIETAADLSALTGWSGDVWMSTGSAKYSPAALPVNDCNGWTHGVGGTYLGNFWRFDSTTGGSGKVSNCGVSFNLACCK